MSVHSQTYLRALAEDELRDAGFTEPPVSAEAVAAHLGVPVREHDLPPWFTAALIYEDGLPAILLNAARPPGIRREGLSHLLAHLLIVIKDADAQYPRDVIAEHTEADFLGAELETPEFMVREQAQKWFNDYRYVAGLFGVTESRMFKSMHDLGIIRGRGVVWEY